MNKKAGFIFIFLLFIIISSLIKNSIAFANQENDAVYWQLKKELEQLLETERGTYGVYVIDLNSGKSMGINHLETFHAASTFKLPLNLYLFKKIAEGTIEPRTMLSIKEEHLEGGTGLLQNKPLGSSYRLEQLSEYSIVYSDNIATNMLLSFLGHTIVKDYMRSLGGQVVDDNKNITCPMDMAIYMNKLLDFASQHPAQGNKLLNFLENTIFTNRIPALLPEDIKVANKIGSWPPENTYNDVGYVRHPENPYIIAIFGKDTPGVSQAINVIQRISKVVYDFQNKLVIPSISLNGQPLKTDTNPVLYNNTLLVPVKAISEELEAKVHWDQSTNKIIIHTPGTKIELTINDDIAYLNGEEIILSIPGQNINNRTMVPLRFISESLGASVSWDNKTKIVSISLS